MKPPYLFNGYLALPLLLVFLAGCASVPDAPSSFQQRAASFSPPPGMALVYVFRPFALERLTATTQLSLDQRTFGTLSSRTFLCVAVKPGPHELKTLSFFGDATQRFHAQAGGLHFFQVEPKPDQWALTPASEAEGREKVTKYRLSGDNAFEAGERPFP